MKVGRGIREHIFFLIFKKLRASLVGLSGKEFTWQRRRHRFDPWSGKIPHALKQLRLSAKLLSLCSRARSHHY